jgi:hypothetical protein
MYVDEISRFIDLRNALGESQVYCFVGRVVRVRRRVFTGDILPKEIMEEWPKS